MALAFAASAALVVAAAGSSFAASNGGGHATHGKVSYHPAKVQAGQFKAYDQPVAKYTSKSCVIDLSSLSDFTPVTSVTGCSTTIKLSSSFEKRSVPGSWGSWSSPPDSESATPNILYSATATTANVSFGKKVTVGGFELEPNQFQVETVTVDFHKKGNGHGAVIGSVTRDVDGSFGARLFGGKGLNGAGWKSASITDTAGDDFAIAQVRV
jgi:hypothetical protein